MANTQAQPFAVRSVMDMAYAMSNNLECTLVHNNRIIIGLIRAIAMEDGSGRSYVVDVLHHHTTTKFYVRF